MTATRRIRNTELKRYADELVNFGLRAKVIQKKYDSKVSFLEAEVERYSKALDKTLNKFSVVCKGCPAFPDCKRERRNLTVGEVAHCPDECFKYRREWALSRRT